MMRRYYPSGAFGSLPETRLHALPSVIVAMNKAIASTESEVKLCKQHIGLGQGNRVLSPNPEALVVDGFRSEQRAGYRNPPPSACNRALKFTCGVSLSGHLWAAQARLPSPLAEPAAGGADCTTRQRAHHRIEH